MKKEDVIDPFGLLAKPTTEELELFKESGYYSMNPYLLQGWLVNHRKNKILEELEKSFDSDNIETDTH